MVRTVNYQLCAKQHSKCQLYKHIQFSQQASEWALLLFPFSNTEKLRQEIVQVTCSKSHEAAGKTGRLAPENMIFTKRVILPLKSYPFLHSECQCKIQTYSVYLLIFCFSLAATHMRLLTLKLTRESCIIAIDLNPEKIIIVKTQCI